MRQLKVVSIVPQNVKANHKLLIGGVLSVVRNLGGILPEQNIVASNALELPIVVNIAKSIQTLIFPKHIIGRIKISCCIGLFFVEGDMAIRLICKLLSIGTSIVVKYAARLFRKRKRVLTISFRYAKVGNIGQAISNWFTKIAILGVGRAGCQHKHAFCNT